VIVLALVLAAAALAGSAYLLVAAAQTWLFSRRAEEPAADGAGVSVLKPLHGADWGLAENLRSFAQQDYPVHQMVCGVREADDPAVPIVRHLAASRPPGAVELVIDRRIGGTNLKISNLENMLPQSRHDLLVIADGDMRVRSDYLAEVTAPLRRPEIGLVTCLYRGIPAGGLWSRLGAMHIDYSFLPSALVSERLRPGQACFGATMALRRETLEAIGGLAALRNQLADDWELGAAVRRLGKRVVLSPHLVDTMVSEPSLAVLMAHELRWARTIRVIEPAGHAGSLLTHPVALAALAMCASGFAPWAWGVLGIASLARLAMVAVVGKSLGRTHFDLALLPLRDLLSFGVFVASFCGRQVAWRDRRFRLTSDGRLVLDGEFHS
jgi:ceramide glucosyltransferase